MNILNVYLLQCFSTFFKSRNLWIINSYLTEPWRSNYNKTIYCTFKEAWKKLVEPRLKNSSQYIQVFAQHLKLYLAKSLDWFLSSNCCYLVKFWSWRHFLSSGIKNIEIKNDFLKRYFWVRMSRVPLVRAVANIWALSTFSGWFLSGHWRFWIKD